MYQYPFMIKTLRKLGIKENFLNLIKNIHTISAANVTLNGKKLEAFGPRLGTRQVCPFSLLLSNIVLEVLLNTVR